MIIKAEVDSLRELYFDGDVRFDFVRLCVDHGAMKDYSTFPEACFERKLQSWLKASQEEGCSLIFQGVLYSSSSSPAQVADEWSTNDSIQDCNPTLMDLTASASEAKMIPGRGFYLLLVFMQKGESVIHRQLETNPV